MSSQSLNVFYFLNILKPIPVMVMLTFYMFDHDCLEGKQMEDILVGIANIKQKYIILFNLNSDT